MKRNQEVFKTLLENLSEEVYKWKQAPDKWCLLEIICHLYDEEQKDFKTRLKHILENKEGRPSPISSDEWAKNGNYMGQNYFEMIEKFLNERDESINWLCSLKNPEWENYYIHPEYGQMTGKMFLANWLAHDYLHIRQIIKLKYDYLSNTTGDDLKYAGGW